MSYDCSTVYPQVKTDWLNPSSSAQMDDVLHIEHLTSSTPRGLEEFRHLLRHGHLCRIILVGEFVAGFLIYHACRAGRKIVAIAVDPCIQRQGVGSLLIECLKRQMADVPRLMEIVAHVPESQLVVQQFLRANRFRWTETIENSAGEGLYVMKCIKPSGLVDEAVARESAGSTAELSW